MLYFWESSSLGGGLGGRYILSKENSKTYSTTKRNIFWFWGDISLQCYIEHYRPARHQGFNFLIIVYTSNKHRYMAHLLKPQKIKLKLQPVDLQILTSFDPRSLCKSVKRFE